MQAHEHSIVDEDYDGLDSIDLIRSVFDIYYRVIPYHVINGSLCLHEEVCVPLESNDMKIMLFNRVTSTLKI